MNCKQGDVAYIVGSKLLPEDQWAAGYIGKCVERYDALLGPAWVMDPMPVAPPGRYQPIGVLDRVLRPLDLPSSTGVDESVRWLPPVPTHHLQEA